MSTGAAYTINETYTIHLGLAQSLSDYMDERKRLGVVSRPTIALILLHLAGEIKNGTIARRLSLNHRNE